MKKLEDILAQWNTPKVFDGRDLVRLSVFLTKEQLESVGLSLKDESIVHVPKPYTEEAVLKLLKEDLAFAFEKALNRRGISASFMHGVIQMWNCVLDNGLDKDEEYAQYGLPLFKKTAILYGFNNPIGSDNGDEEDKYSEKAPWADN